MGLNLIVRTMDGQDHPDWDDARYSGDRQIFDIIKGVPGIDEIRDPGFGNANDWYWRPTDFQAFRNADWPDVNADRWRQLADILEADDSYWITVSV